MVKAVTAPRRPSNALKTGDETRFAEVLELIEAARSRAYQAVNSELVSLYWQLGEYVSRKIASAEWGDAVVDELAAVLARRYPGLRGFTRRNTFRMRQLLPPSLHRAQSTSTPQRRRSCPCTRGSAVSRRGRWNTGAAAPKAVPAETYRGDVYPHVGLGHP